MYVPGEGKMAHGEKMSEIKLPEKGAVCTEGKGPNWHCEFKVPFELLPPRTEEYYVQILHFHKVKTEAGDVKSFTGAVCPRYVGPGGNEFKFNGYFPSRALLGKFLGL